jgi:hypothetical protein
VDEPERARRVLKHLNAAITVGPGGIVISSESGCAPAEINALLVRAGIAVSQLTMRHSTLEDAFLDITSNDIAKGEAVTL